MPYLAHVRPSTHGPFVEHELSDHLQAVAALAAAFSHDFASEDWGYLAGLWHDLGKYSDDFQRYIKSASGYNSEAHVENEAIPGKVNHSTAGAIYAVQQLGVHGRILAYLIAGHHAGLPDWTKLEGGTGGVLQERLQMQTLLQQALAAPIPETILQAAKPASGLVGGKRGFALWVRLLFSCLVDADFLDTETFMDDGDKANQRRYTQTLPELQTQFNQYITGLTQRSPATLVNAYRAQILAQCTQRATDAPGIFSLTVPTGGGKTLSSLAFALEHSCRYDKKRIIYVIPYTSIIEQTANIFRSIFGDAVIEHHSNLDSQVEDSKSRLACENWDAPLIVTTSVQFFESLFAARTSRCRKLHNIVNSVVVLDEAQLLPLEFLQPILEVINLLAQHYGVTFVLSTATQPAFSSLKNVFGQSVIRGLNNVREIMANPADLFQQFNRVEVSLPADFQSPTPWETLAQQLTQHSSVLAIVNTRADARTLHALMPTGTLHLSALMCGQHRSVVIAEIKAKLTQNQPIRVVSTQLVEAGVDIDFPVVYRAWAGLDSIAQAAGRCNREGNLPGKGRVMVFIPPKPAPPGHLRTTAEVTRSLLTGLTGDPLDYALFKTYFERLYHQSVLDKYGINDLLTPQGSGNDSLKVQFRTAANQFKLIDESGYYSVLVRYNETAGQLLALLKAEGPKRWLMRKLQRFVVTVPQYQFQRLQQQGLIDEIHSGIYAQHPATICYHPVLGLLMDDTILHSVDSLIY